MAKKKKAPVVVRRQEVGLMVHGGGRAFPGCYVLYEEWLSDGSTRLKRGYLLRGCVGSQDLNGTKKERERAALSLASPEMEQVMHSAVIIQNMLIQRCLEMDKALGMPSGEFFLDGKNAGGRDTAK